MPIEYAGRNLRDPDVMNSIKKMMEIHVNVLFNHNEKGLITTVNEPPYEPAPMLYIGLTGEGHLIRYREDINETTISKLGSAIGTDPGNRLTEIVEALNTVERIRRIWLGPAFMFPKVKRDSDIAIRISRSNRALLRKHFPFLFNELELKEPVFAVVADGAAV
ncbi:MAG: hypothetical protein KIS30_05950 [Thermoplasmata archaeon]|nr:hypothetical protein [Candidatus Sysuiplasma acidicola]MBX8646282.1 hypothetical protein [Candidatus Sysuiplasma acidicola]